jgi:predicted CoA-substrate-specific enzyme activase
LSLSVEPGIVNMHTCGIDIGSKATKVVVMGADGKVAGRGHRPTGSHPAIAAEEALRAALLAARMDRHSLDSIATTGYGRRLVPRHDVEFTAVGAHAAGAYYAFPGTRNVLAVGALRSAAIRLSEDGHVHRFRLNDRCGAGVGRYLERVADTLEIPLEEIGQLALFSRNPQPVPSICSVLAESEVLNLITQEHKPADILAGVCLSLAERLAALVKQVWLADRETTLTGGVAKNAGMVKALEEVLGKRLNIGHDAEFMGAIGAAVLARDAARGAVSGSV